MLKHMGDRPNMQMSESFRIIWNHSEFQIQVLNQFPKKITNWSFMILKWFDQLTWNDAYEFVRVGAHLKKLLEY